MIHSHVWNFLDHIRIPTHMMHMRLEYELLSWQSPTPTPTPMACRSLTPCTKCFSLRMAKGEARQCQGNVCTWHVWSERGVRRVRWQLLLKRNQISFKAHTQMLAKHVLHIDKCKEIAIPKCSLFPEHTPTEWGRSARITQHVVLRCNKELRSLQHRLVVQRAIIFLPSQVFDIGVMRMGMGFPHAESLWLPINITSRTTKQSSSAVHC